MTKQAFDFLAFAGSALEGWYVDDIVLTARQVAPSDWYHFSLGDGDSATLAVTSPTGDIGSLELYDDVTGLLAKSAPANNVGAGLDGP